MMRGMINQGSIVTMRRDHLDATHRMHILHFNTLFLLLPVQLYPLSFLTFKQQERLTAVRTLLFPRLGFDLSEAIRLPSLGKLLPCHLSAEEEIPKLAKKFLKIGSMR
jgi:hypothetical protein